MLSFFNKQELSAEDIEIIGKENIHDKYEITHASNGDNYLYKMFTGWGVEGNPNSTVQIRFIIDKNHVTACKVVPDNELQSLARYEASTVKKIYNQNLVPLFAVPINAYGKLQQQKNDNGEELSSYELKNTKFAEATHINFTPLPDSRLTLGLTENQKEKYYSIKELEAMDLSVELDDKQCLLDTDDGRMFEADAEVPRYHVASVSGGDKNLYKMFLDTCIE